MDNVRYRIVIYLVAIASFFIILFGIRESAEVLNPILLAAVITIVVLPIPGKLKSRGLPGWLSLVVTILVVTLVLGLVILVLFVSVTALARDLPVYLGGGTQQTEASTSSSETDADSSSTSGTEAETDSAGSQEGGEAAGSETETTLAWPQFSEFSLGVIGGVVDLLVQFGWALLIFFFMLSAAISMPAPSRMGMDPDLPAINRLSSLTEDVRKYMSILTMVNFLVGFGDLIFLLILGVEYAALWGLLAWLMGYIPSIGFMIALIPPVLLAYAQFGIEMALVVLLGYILINGGVQNIIQPKIMGQGLKISPVVVFIGLFVWGYLLGGIGAILAVPLTMLVLIIMENFPGTYNLAVLMRYTGEEKKEERQQAARSLKGTLERVNVFSRRDKDSNDTDKGENGETVAGGAGMGEEELQDGGSSPE